MALGKGASLGTLCGIADMFLRSPFDPGWHGMNSPEGFADIVIPIAVLPFHLLRTPTFLQNRVVTFYT